MFALRGNASAAGTQQALAYAAPGPGPTDAVEVPLPPRRPTALSAEPVQVASLAQPTAPQPQASLQPQAATAQAAAPQVAAAQAMTAVDAVEVPLPPRRPSETVLAAIPRPAIAVAARKLAEPAPIREASAAPVTP